MCVVLTDTKESHCLTKTLSLCVCMCVVLTDTKESHCLTKTLSLCVCVVLTDTKESHCLTKTLSLCVCVSILLTQSRVIVLQRLLACVCVSILQTQSSHCLTKTLSLCVCVCVCVVLTDTKLSQWTADVDRRIWKGVHVAMERSFVKPGDPVVILTGWKPGSGSTNTMRVVAVTDVLEHDLLPPITGLSSVPSFNRTASDVSSADATTSVPSDEQMRLLAS